MVTSSVLTEIGTTGSLDGGIYERVDITVGDALTAEIALRGSRSNRPVVIRHLLVRLPAEGGSGGSPRLTFTQTATDVCDSLTIERISVARGANPDHTRSPVSLEFAEIADFTLLETDSTVSSLTLRSTRNAGRFDVRLGRGVPHVVVGGQSLTVVGGASNHLSLQELRGVRPIGRVTGCSIRAIAAPGANEGRWILEDCPPLTHGVVQLLDPDGAPVARYEPHRSQLTRGNLEEAVAHERLLRATCETAPTVAEARWETWRHRRNEATEPSDRLVYGVLALVGYGLRPRPAAIAWVVMVIAVWMAYMIGDCDRFCSADAASADRRSALWEFVWLPFGFFGFRTASDGVLADLTGGWLHAARFATGVPLAVLALALRARYRLPGGGAGRR